MSGPYRESDGIRCPSCDRVLAPDDHGEICSEGCGTWLDRAAIESLFGVNEFSSPAAAYWKATPLGKLRCPSCIRVLDDSYAKLGDEVLTLGRCIDHGVWVARGTYGDFTTAHANQIAAHLNAARARSSSSDGRDSAATRIEHLERRVAELESRIATIERLGRPIR